MAGKKISELQALTEITGREIIPVAKDGQNYGVESSLLQGGEDVIVVNVNWEYNSMARTEIPTIPAGTYDKLVSNGVSDETKKPIIFHSSKIGIEGVPVEYGAIQRFNLVNNVELDSATNDIVLEFVNVVETNTLDAGYDVVKWSLRITEYNDLAAGSYNPISILKNGAGDKFLSDDGTYKTPAPDNTAFDKYAFPAAWANGMEAIPSGAATDLKNMIQGYYFNSNGKLAANASSYYQYVDIVENTILKLKVPISGEVIYMLVLFDKDDNVMATYRRNIDRYFVFNGVAKIGISCSGTSEGSVIVKQIPFTLRNEDMSNRALYEAAGAVYNEDTGFYELNGLTDITEAEMRTIYSAYFPNYPGDATALYSRFQIRTNLPVKSNPGGWTHVLEVSYLFAACSQLEVALMGVSKSLGYITPVSCMGMFHNCSKLKTVLGIIDMQRASSSTANMFYNCLALEDVNIKNLHVNISFANSPLISLASLQYLIANASTTAACTVTVHADVYAKIQDETQTEWHALIASAQEKQITFATA